jgi:phage-related protein
MPDKPLTWLGSSQRDVRALPPDAKRLVGFQLRRVQHGLDPNDWKPMTTVGVGVREIRIHTGLEHRVLYIATFAEAVYVLHAFEKKTRKTATSDVNLAKQRFRELIVLRRTLEHGAKK